MEHRNFSDRDVQTLLVHSHLHDIDIMVRPPTLEKTRLYRYLEDGAAGSDDSAREHGRDVRRRWSMRSSIRRWETAVWTVRAWMLITSLTEWTASTRSWTAANQETFLVDAGGNS
jgi:hypothetical protein